MTNYFISCFKSFNFYYVEDLSPVQMPKLFVNLVSYHIEGDNRKAVSH